MRHCCQAVEQAEPLAAGPRCVPKRLLYARVGRVREKEHDRDVSQSSPTAAPRGQVGPTRDADHRPVPEVQRVRHSAKVHHRLLRQSGVAGRAGTCCGDDNAREYHLGNCGGHPEPRRGKEQEAHGEEDPHCVQLPGPIPKHGHSGCHLLLHQAEQAPGRQLPEARGHEEIRRFKTGPVPTDEPEEGHARQAHHQRSKPRAPVLDFPAKARRPGEDWVKEVELLLHSERPRLRESVELRPVPKVVQGVSIECHIREPEERGLARFEVAARRRVEQAQGHGGEHHAADERRGQALDAPFVKAEEEIPRARRGPMCQGGSDDVARDDKENVHTQEAPGDDLVVHVRRDDGRRTAN